MGHPINLIPCTPLNTSLPVDVRARLDLHLFSDVEGRVPKGAYQRLLTELINQYLDNRVLDLAPYFGTLPEEAIVRGSSSVIARLKQAFEYPTGEIKKIAYPQEKQNGG